uniref:Uncharacterized protein n=1 Tax=Anguilla anguilla TaxID=7936 RepID=A0A0E9R9Q8_ANGAN
MEIFFIYIIINILTFYFCVLHGLLLFSLCAYLDRTVSLHWIWPISIAAVALFWLSELKFSNFLWNFF